MIDRRVLCDRTRMQQLLSNLLGNALTYGALDEPVRVDAAVEGDCVVLSVANGGTPIEADDLRPGLRTLLASGDQQAGRRARPWPLYLLADRPGAWRRAGSRFIGRRGHALHRAAAHLRLTQSSHFGSAPALRAFTLPMNAR